MVLSLLYSVQLVRLTIVVDSIDRWSTYTPYTACIMVVKVAVEKHLYVNRQVDTRFYQPPMQQSHWSNFTTTVTSIYTLLTLLCHPHIQISVGLWVECSLHIE